MATSTTRKPPVKRAAAKTTEVRKYVGKVGNLTRDPEMRFSPNGTAWVTFGIAVNSPKTPGDWSGEQETTFYDVVAFNSLAENIVESLTKGTRVVVYGYAEVDKWQDSEGNDRETKKIVADGVGPDLRFATAEVTKTTRTNGAPVKGTNGDEDF